MLKDEDCFASEDFGACSFPTRFFEAGGSLWGRVTSQFTCTCPEFFVFAEGELFLLIRQNHLTQEVTISMRPYLNFVSNDYCPCAADLQENRIRTAEPITADFFNLHPIYSLAHCETVIMKSYFSFII